MPTFREQVSQAIVNQIRRSFTVRLLRFQIFLLRYEKILNLAIPDIVESNFRPTRSKLRKEVDPLSFLYFNFHYIYIKFLVHILIA